MDDVERAKLHRFEMEDLRILRMARPPMSAEEESEFAELRLKAGEERRHEEMKALRTKAKARLMVKLLVSAFSAVASASIGHARIMASTAVDAMTDDEVLLVEW